MARDLVMLTDSSPSMGPLSKPCLRCGCKWGYKDLSSNGSTHAPIDIYCGQCGRLQHQTTVKQAS